MMKAHKNLEKSKRIASVLDLHHRFICRLQPDRSKVNPPPCVIIFYCSVRSLRNAELYRLDLYRVFLGNDYLGQRSERRW